MTRKEDDEYTTFAATVNKHCDDFKLADLSADSFKCLIFVQGLVSTKDAEIRRRVLNKLENEPDITLQKIAEDCQRFVSVKQDSRDIEESGISHIKNVHQSKNYRKKSKQPSNGSHTWNKNPPIDTKKFCEKCGRRGHKSSYCKGKSYVKSTKSEDQQDNIRKYVAVKILKKDVRFQLDSGSDITIINLPTWIKLGRPTMLRSSKIARSVTGEKLQFEGEVITNVTLKNKTLKLKMFVLRDTNNLFGTDWIESFELWDSPINEFCQNVENLTAEAEHLKKELKETFPDVFSGRLGCCSKMKAKLELKENTMPVRRKPRPVPYASQQQIEEELNRLEAAGILSKVDYSEWAAPTVYVRKKSKEIRVCADFSTGLNDVLKDHHYPLPNPEDVFTKLNGGKYFSKIDLSEAYLQIPLEEESSKLMCIATHKGLYKFNRMAFGVKVAPAIFQQVMDTMLNDLDFAIAYLDDILMNSVDKKQHREHVMKVFERIQEFGFTLKETKCEFFLEEIRYLGHIIDKDGRRPDPERSAAIKNMPAPHNVATLQSFLGLANYYQVFISGMHELRAPLNNLLKKGQNGTGRLNVSQLSKK